MRYLKYVAYACIPASYLVHYQFRGAAWEPVVAFLLAAMGVLPLAALMGRATEHLAIRAGPRTKW
jgi:Ca2+/H+ antiporter